MVDRPAYETLTSEMCVSRDVDREMRSGGRDAATSRKRRMQDVHLHVAFRPFTLFVLVCPPLRLAGAPCAFCVRGQFVSPPSKMVRTPYGVQAGYVCMYVTYIQYVLYCTK